LSARARVSVPTTISSSAAQTGYSIDGCHAEFAVADARFAVAVPPGSTRSR
jgi:D-arabinose 1-dehydrogenase-like Zn-dependent alcohol dehydrogenase